MSTASSAMSSDTFKPLLLKLMNTPGKFTPEDTKLSMRHLATHGCVLPAQAGAFLAALKSSKIEHLPETLAAAAEVMREYAVHVPLDEPDVYAVDMVGTGGDGHNTFNVSTTAAIVAAGAGARVVKVSRSPILIVYLFNFGIRCSMGTKHRPPHQAQPTSFSPSAVL